MRANSEALRYTSSLDLVSSTSRADDRLLWLPSDDNHIAHWRCARVRQPVQCCLPVLSDASCNTGNWRLTTDELAEIEAHDLISEADIHQCGRQLGDAIRVLVVFEAANTLFPAVHRQRPLPAKRQSLIR